MSKPPFGEAAKGPASGDNEAGPSPDVQLLKKLLDGDLTPSEQTEVMGLVESQPAWQKAIEKLSAGMRSWQQVADHLREPPVPVDAKLREILARFDSANGNTIDVEKRSPRAGTGLEFLSPSGDGQFLGQLREYQIQEILGQGGMGMVLKAFDPPLHRVVALKVMNPQLATVAAARRRFVREAQAAAAVVHENVVTIHGVDESGPLPMIVMACVPGQSLQERIDDAGPLPVREILRIGLQTASGLAAAHAQGLVHRDVKPANILLENGVQRVKLTDFGLARAVDDASMTMTGVVSGTPQFMSPEQARGDEIDFRTDLFSLGSVMYAMCAGRAPFRASTVMGVLRRVCEEPARPLRELNPEIPEWLAAVVDKLMSKVRTERYQTASEVASVLEQCLAHNQRPELMPLPEAVLDLLRDRPEAAEAAKPQVGPVIKPQAGLSAAGKSNAKSSNEPRRNFLPGPGISNSILFMIGAGLEVAAVLILLMAPEHHSGHRLYGSLNLVVPMIMFCGMILGLWNFLFRRVTWSGVPAGGWVLITKIAAATALMLWDFSTSPHRDNTVTFILWLNIIVAAISWAAAELLRRMALYSPWLPVGATLVLVPLTCIVTVPLSVISSYQRASLDAQRARYMAEEAAQRALTDRARYAEEQALALLGGEARVFLSRPPEMTILFRNLQTKFEKKLDGVGADDDPFKSLSVQLVLPAGEYLVRGFAGEGDAPRKLVYSRVVHLRANQNNVIAAGHIPVLEQLQARWKPLSAVQNGMAMPPGQAPWLTFDGENAILSLNDKKSSTYHCRWNLSVPDQHPMAMTPMAMTSVPMTPMMEGMGSSGGMMMGGGAAGFPSRSTFELLDLDGKLKFRGEFDLTGETLKVQLTAMNGESFEGSSPSGMATPGAMSPMGVMPSSSPMTMGSGMGGMPVPTTVSLVMVVEGSPLDRIQGSYELAEESGDFPLEVGAAGNFEHKQWLVDGTLLNVSSTLRLNMGELKDGLRTLDTRDELGRAIRGIMAATSDGLIIQFGVPDGRRPDNTEAKEGEYHARLARPAVQPAQPMSQLPYGEAGNIEEQEYLFKLRGDLKLTLKDLSDGKEFSFPTVDDSKAGSESVHERKLSLPQRPFLVTGSVGDNVLITQALRDRYVDFSLSFLRKLRGDWTRASAEIQGRSLDAGQLSKVHFDDSTVVLTNLALGTLGGGSPAAEGGAETATEFRVEWEHTQMLGGRLFDKEGKLMFRILLNFEDEAMNLLLIPAAETVPTSLSTSPFSNRILLSLKKPPVAAEPKPSEPKAEEPKPAKPKADQPKPEEPKPAEPKPEEAKPEEQ